jgi:glycosyltransferase involved in cell wall biosynthesis
MKISACMMCFNEERRIEKALESLSWADEVVVVDSFSEDKTPEIAKKYAHQFIQNKWPGHAKQMQYAMEKATHDWVFFLDADEACTPELIERIKKIREHGKPPHNLYKVHRKEHMWGFWYKYGCGNPSYQDRFFNRKGVRYEGAVHIYPVVDGAPGWLHEYIHHDSFESLEDMLDKLNSYTTIEAKDMFSRGIRHNGSYMFFSGLVMFLKGYFKKRGFLDGPYGLIMAVCDGLSFFMRQAKLWRLWNEADKKKATN